MLTRIIAISKMPKDA